MYALNLKKLVSILQMINTDYAFDDVILTLFEQFVRLKID